MSERQTAITAGSLVAAAVVALWLAFGVSVWEIARFAAYEAVLVGLPGVLVYRVLSSHPGGVLRHVAIGWPLGYAIGIGAFALTAALGVREAYPLIPLAAAAAAALALRRRRPAERDDAGDAKEAPGAALPAHAVWGIAAVAALAVAYIAIGYFTVTPLPGDTASVSYEADNVFDISVVAEAKNHWPMQYPGVSDTSLRYHIFGFVHMASVSQVTGIEPATLLFRLVPALLVVLVAIQAATLGRALGRSPWLPPVAAALVLLVGELDLDPDRISPFGDTFFLALPHSPSFLFGLPLFLAIVTFIAPRLGGTEPSAKRGWALLGALMLAAGGAKASVLPVVLGALVLWLAWAWWTRGRPLPRFALTAAALAFGCFALTYAVLYSGGGGGGVELKPFGFAEFTVFEEADASGALGAILAAVAPLPSIAALCLPALGVAWVIRERGLKQLLPVEAWLLALLLTGLAAFAVLSQAALAQAYFLNYGYVAGAILAAKGIVLFAQRAVPAAGGPLVPTAAIAVALLAGGVAAALLYDDVEIATPERLALVYALVAVAIAAIALAARRLSSGPAAPAVASLGLLLAISLGLLNTPLDYGVPALDKLRAGVDQHTPNDPEMNRGLTSDLYEGLRWVRDNSDEDELIAVNNHSLDAQETRSRYFYYTAFAERRAFLESWDYTIEAAQIGLDRVYSGEEIPFPERRRLNAELFDDASPEAAATLRDEYGVDLLLVDQLHGGASPSLARLGTEVFSNPALTVYRLD